MGSIITNSKKQDTAESLNKKAFVCKTRSHVWTEQKQDVCAVFEILVLFVRIYLRENPQRLAITLAELI